MTDGEAARVRELHLADIEEVRAKRDQLAVDSWIRRSLTDELLRCLADDIRTAPPRELLYRNSVPLFGYLAIRTGTEIAELDRAISVLIPRHESPEALTQFLRARVSERGLLYAGLFETWVKSTLIDQGQTVGFDFPLENGRNCDIRLMLSQRPLHLECSVLTEDNESAAVMARWCEAKRDDPELTLIRPGRFCPSDARGPSPYYDTQRMYAKVFDKVAKYLNPRRSQLSATGPNILLVSCSGAISADAPGFGWAIDELFVEHPRSIQSANSVYVEARFENWLFEHHSRDLIRTGELDAGQFERDLPDIFNVLRRLSGIILFDDCDMVVSQINDASNDQNRITPSEMAELEALLRAPCPFWPSLGQLRRAVAGHFDE